MKNDLSCTIMHEPFPAVSSVYNINVRKFRNVSKNRRFSKTKTVENGLTRQYGYVIITAIWRSAKEKWCVVYA
ncbi:MAG: hypothetical protein LIV11_09235 [Bacillota bacterium]|nr:hypothetical protein [Bacillota bacterium]